MLLAFLCFFGPIILAFIFLIIRECVRRVKSRNKYKIYQPRILTRMGVVYDHKEEKLVSDHTKI